MKEIRECKHHGSTTFLYFKDGFTKDGEQQFRWRCRKCSSEAVDRRRKKVKLLSIKYKGGKCQRCGYKDLRYPEVFEFHHKDPNKKDFGIAKSGITRSFEKVEKELDKCDLYCANCHRIIHVLKRNNPE